MYGYVRPDKAELRVRDYELFRAAYCGLCEALRRRYGVAARFVVNYDLTFLAMVLSDSAAAQLRRCPVHPVQKRACICGSKALDAAADYSVILAWWKLKDNAHDDPFPKSALYGSGAALFRKAYEKAAAAQSAFDANARKCLRELSDLEGEKSPSLDRAADCFARILAFAAQESGSEQEVRIRRELFYHVGRYVYILDAYDDLAEDVKTGNYNPLAFRLAPGESVLGEEEKTAVRATLNHSQRSAAAALELRRDDAWQPILENIVMNGLPAVTDLVFAGKWNSRNTERKGKPPTRGVDKL